MTHKFPADQEDPPRDGSLSQTPPVQELIHSLILRMESIKERGALVFDIDETLMSPDASLRDETEVRELLLRLLRKGILLGLISGGPGTVVKHRIFDPLIESLGANHELLFRFYVYANGGSSKYAADKTGRFAEDLEYASAHRISGRILYRIKDLIESYAGEGFRLGELLPGVVQEWKRKRSQQWNATDVFFDDSWMEQRPWKADLWDDEAMARVKAGKEKGRTTFPFINVRRGSLSVEGRVEELSGISVSGFYSLRKENGDLNDLDCRDEIIKWLTKDLGGDARDIVMKKAGRASIDITKSGTDKSAALFDFISHWKCSAGLVFYFGDEFFHGGNDLPVAEAPALSAQKVSLIALNRQIKPSQSGIVWAGRSCAATRELLKRVLDAQD